MVEPLRGWVDETGWLKQGIHSVGVSHKYCGAVGKQPQCQVAVELVVSDGEIAAPAGGAGFIGRRGGAKDQVLRKGGGRARWGGLSNQAGRRRRPDRRGLGRRMTTAPVLGDSVFGNAAELRWRLRGLRTECFFQAEEHWLAWAQRPPPAHGSKCWSVAKTAPAARRLRQWVESFKKGVEVARGGLGSADGHRRTTCLAWKQIYLTTIWKKTKEKGSGAGWRSIGRKTSRIPIMCTSPNSDSLRPRPVLCA